MKSVHENCRWWSPKKSKVDGKACRAFWKILILVVDDLHGPVLGFSTATPPHFFRCPTMLPKGNGEQNPGPIPPVNQRSPSMVGLKTTLNPEAEPTAQPRIIFKHLVGIVENIFPTGGEDHPIIKGVTSPQIHVNVIV